MVSVDENRVQFELDLITDLIFKYFEYIAHFVFDQNVTQDITDIDNNIIPNIYNEIIEEGFELYENGYTISDFLDNEIRNGFDIEPTNTFFAGNLLDETINLLVKKIQSELNISNDILNTCSKQSIVQLYSCAFVRANPDKWYNYIYENILEQSNL